MEKVAVVILNYKVKDLVLKAVESVKRSSYKNIQIIVVDNNSEDGVEEILKKDIEVIFIQSGDNLGYSGGNNLGIKKGLTEGAKWVFILNPDATIKPDTLEILLKKANEYNAQLLNPKIYFDDSKTLWFAGKIFDKANVLGSHKGVDQQDNGQFDQDIEMDDVTGAALLIKKEVFEKIGFFDERYFLYYEESDFATRAKKAGFKIMYIPKAVTYHKNAQSTGLGTPLQDYFITRNRMLYASKFLPLRTRFALLREGLRNLKNNVRRLALFDFLMGKFGKGSFLK